VCIRIPTLVFLVVFAALPPGVSQVNAQGRDGLLNGTAIGAAVGAGVGVAFTHAVRDSDLGFDQYAYGALVFAGIGAAVGLSVDALLNRQWLVPPKTDPRVLIAPRVWHDAAGVAVRWRW